MGNGICEHHIDIATKIAAQDERLNGVERRVETVEVNFNDLVQSFNSYVMKIASASVSIMLVIATFVVAIVKGWIG